MVSVPEALETILAEARPLGAEHVALLEARGRVLARDIVADQDVPGLPRSSVDGYAVVSGDTSANREVLAEVTAGRLAHAQVGPGTAVRIMTGGTLPPGADAVIMVEEAEEADGRVTFQKVAAPGENIHPPGMDLADGQVVLRKGHVLGAAEIGVLATVGQTQVPVYRRPRVAVLATGDEIVEPYNTPGPGQVRDSNRYALMAAAAEAGAEIAWHAHGLDEEAELERLLRTALETADVVITSGGVSMGTRDLIKPLIDRLGSIRFGRVAFKPGKPLTFAVAGDDKLIFGLPGFPVSSLVTFEVFVRPALRTLGGFSQRLRPRVQVHLAHALRPDPLRLEYARAHVTWVDGQWVARTTGLQASSRLLSIVGANALLEVLPAEETLPMGAPLTALLLADL